jgi:hypothetical protein
MLDDVEREREKLTKLSIEKKKLMNSFIHSIKYEMTFSIKDLIKQMCPYIGTKENETKAKKKLTPSAPLLSLIAVDVEGGLSLPLFVLEYWLAVDILLSNIYCPCENNSYYCYDFFFLLFFCSFY